MALGLLDLSFRRLVTPRLLGWVYVLAFSAVSTVTLVSAMFIWSLAEWMGPGMWWFLPPLLCGALASLLAVRVTLEVAMVYMRGHLSADAAPPPPPVPASASASAVGAGVPYGSPYPGGWSA